MDNFRKHKKNRVRPTPVDVLVTPSKAPKHVGLKPGGAPSFNRTSNRPRLGNFKRAGGLHPTQQGRIGFGGSGPQMSRDLLGKAVAGAAALDKKPAVKVKKARRTVRIIKRSALALAAVMVIGGGYLGVKTYLESRKILAGGGGAAALTENVGPTLLSGEGDGRVNILLMGTGGASYDNGSYLVDTIIVASIDPINKDAALLSIPRDFYIKTNSYGSMRINAVFSSARRAALRIKPKDVEAANRAGTKAMEKVVESTMGIPIHYNAMIDFKGFENAINTVGGITMTVPPELAVYEFMYINGKNYTLNVKAGKQKFDGFRALAFARSRKTSTRGDFSRSERQRLMLVALMKKISSLETLANPVKINNLLSDFGNHARSTLTVGELLRVYEIMSEIEPSKVDSVSLVDEPNILIKSANIGGSVQIPRAGLNNYTEIQSYIRNKLRDGFLRKENASLVIYNGTTTSGLAARTTADLKSYGYKAKTGGDAPTKTYAKTMLIDLRDGKKKYTQHYLEKRLGVLATTKLPAGITAGTADFVIIVGTDEVNRLD